MLNGLRTQLTRPAAFHKFRGDFSGHVQTKSPEQSEGRKFHKAGLRELEARQANFVRATGEKHALGTLLPALEDVERKLAAVRAKIEATRPRPIAQPALYQRHIDDLVATLNREEIVEWAADELHRLIERVIVRPQAEAGGHSVEIFGNLVERLRAADSKNTTAYNAAACSPNLVAGAGFYLDLRHARLPESALQLLAAERTFRALS